MISACFDRERSYLVILSGQNRDNKCKMNNKKEEMDLMVQGKIHL